MSSWFEMATIKSAINEEGEPCILASSPRIR